MKKNSFLLVLLISSIAFSCKFQSPKSIVCEEDTAYPFIEDSVTAKILGVMADWFDFYNINVSDFRLVESDEIDVESQENDAVIYLRKYTCADNLFLPQIRDYSPDHRYHLNLLEASNVKQASDGKWHFFDNNNTDPQYIFLFDKEESALLLAAIHDVDNYSDAAFWLDNNTFVLSGKRFLGENQNRYYFNIYNLTDRVKDSYCLNDSLLSDGPKSYFKEVNLKRRNVVVN